MSFTTVAGTLLDEAIAWVPDETRFSEALKEAIAQGKASLHDGVAYWARGSGRTGVIQHLPFKEVPLQHSEDLMRSVASIQGTVLVASAVSTTLILAAIVVQTKYLAGKIEAVRHAVDQVSSKLDEQNIVFCIDRLSTYLGHLETARTLLADRDAADEIQDIGSSFLPILMSERNSALSLVDGVMQFCRDREVAPEHLKALLGFSQSCLDIVPKGIHLEYLFAARLGKPLLAERLLVQGSERYGQALGGFRNHMNAMAHAIVEGRLGKDRKEAFDTFEPTARALLASSENQLLLALPEIRVAPPNLRLVA